MEFKAMIFNDNMGPLINHIKDLIDETLFDTLCLMRLLV